MTTVSRPPMPSGGGSYLRQKDGSLARPDEMAPSSQPAQTAETHPDETGTATQKPLKQTVKDD